MLFLFIHIISVFNLDTDLKIITYLKLLLLLFYLFIPLSLIAQKTNESVSFDTKKQVSQFLIDTWDSDKGLPYSTLRQVFQTKDKYIWVGGYEGLLRFDGNNFDYYSSNTIPELKTNSVTRFAESLDSTLWIGTQGSGLLSYKNGIFKVHGLEKEYITAIHILDETDSMYVGTRSGGLFGYDIKTQKFTSIFKNQLGKEAIYDILEYPKGKFWLGTRNNGVLTLENNILSEVESEVGKSATLRLYLDNQNKVWAGTYNGVVKYQEGKFIRKFKAINERIYDMKFDLAGNFWIATHHNIYRNNPRTDELELLKSNTNEPFEDTRSIYIDKEDNLWIPSIKQGLCRLYEGKFLNYTTRQGLDYSSINSLTTYNDKDILVGTTKGHLHIIDVENNKVTDYPTKINLTNQELLNIRQDKEGIVWISTYKGLIRKDIDGTERVFTEKDGLPTKMIVRTYQDSKGRFWIGTRGEGLVEMKKDSTTNQYTFEKISTERGFDSYFIMSIREDNRGNLLVATNDKGIFIERGNKFESFGIEEGLPTNLIFNMYCDKENTIWIASSAGIIRWKDDEKVFFGTENDFVRESIFDILEDRQGYFWLSTNKGVLCIKKKDINDLVDKKITKLTWKRYSKYNGMASEQCTGAASSLMSKNGDIWIPTFGGVLKIQPNLLKDNRYLPSVYIKQISLDDEISLEPKNITIEPDQQRLIIEFTALSWKAPQTTKLKYKLQGFDKEWTTVTSKRQATYTSLPHGEYTFKVIAANNDGVWNNEGATLKIIVKPHIYQTKGFMAAIFLLLMAGVWGVVSVRTKIIKAKAKELEEIVKLRTNELQSTNSELMMQQKVVKAQNKNIISSINYAKRIQVAMLPTREYIQKILPKLCILFLPRDIVSGDFYWIEEYNEKVIVATVDCTGHGVPGAFMSLIANDILNKVVLDYSITEPQLILDVLNQEVITILNQKKTDNRDGMDMNIWVWNKKKNIVEFAGAKNPLIYIKNQKLYEIKANSMPIGGNSSYKIEQKYIKHTIKVDAPITIYTFSDGYQDQFGGVKNKKYMKSKFKQLLLEIHALPMPEQHKILKETFIKWKQNYEQIDDVLVMGVKIIPTSNK